MTNDLPCLNKCKTIRGCVGGLRAGRVRAWVCEAVQTIAREQMSIWGVLQLPPLLGRPERYSALGPGHLCTSAQLGDPCLASRDTSKNPPSPSGYLGLSCQGPAT